jgi:hypothetical protein
MVVDQTPRLEVVPDARSSFNQYIKVNSPLIEQKKTLYSRVHKKSSRKLVSQSVDWTFLESPEEAD